MKRKITFYILFGLMLGSIGTKAFALPSESFGSPRAPLHYFSSFSNAVKNDYSSRWNSGDIREMGSVAGEGLITLLTAGVKYADNAGRLGKTGAFIQKLKKLKRLRKVKSPKTIQSMTKASRGRFKRTIKNLSKPDNNPGLSQRKLDQLRRISAKADAKVRVDLDGVRGAGIKPHAHVEGMGSKIENRHIWLREGVE